MSITKEVRRIRRALFLFRFDICRTRLMLCLLCLPEKCGSKTAHSVADDCRDMIGHSLYAIEEYETNLWRIKSGRRKLRIA